MRYVVREAMAPRLRGLTPWCVARLQDDMSAFLQNKNTVEASIVKLNDDTRKLEELQERSACAVDGAEEAGTCPASHTNVATVQCSATGSSPCVGRGLQL